MDAFFDSWLPATWTMLGALFPIFSFALFVFVVSARRDIVNDRLERMLEVAQAIQLQTADLRLGNLGVIEEEVNALRTAMVPHGGPGAQTILNSLRVLTTDLQGLAAASREAGADMRSLTDSQLPVAVLLEILAELRQFSKGDLKIQRRLAPFSFFSFEKTLAKGLIQERIQAKPSPFHELD